MGIATAPEAAVSSPTITRRRGLHRINSPAQGFEPKRDWSLGFITGHRTRIVFCMTLITVVLYTYQDLIWRHGGKPAHTLFQDYWAWSSILWCGAVIPGLLGLFGMLAYRHPRKLDEVAPIQKLVSWRIVTKGTNIEAVRSTILRCQREMAMTPLFPYVIEVIIEEKSRWDLLPTGPDIFYYRIPEDYETPNKSEFKARALQFALENATLPGDAWIVHLDEETQPTSSGVKGICRMITEEEESGELRVGQGAILYHRAWKEHPILTLADMVRSGDDFARFHFQHRLGRTVFGLHGSYIVVRNDVEQLAGFDFGPVGSITEDAFWALVLMQMGVRARWCEGYLEEQSTQSAMDFVKQRARWYRGLKMVSIHAPVKLRWRLCLGTNTLLWTFAPFAAIYTVIHFFYGFQTEFVVRMLANLSYASFTTLYLTGLKANMDEHGITGWHRRTGWTIAQLVLTPFFSVMESCGVLLGILKPSGGFHVVKK